MIGWDMADTTKERQAAHFRRMAAATAELAEWSDEPEIAAAYRALEAHWLARMAGVSAGVPAPRSVTAA